MIEIRRIDARELDRVGEIDRTERIDTLYVQRGTELETVHGEFNAPRWRAHGEGPHSVAHQVAECRRYVAAGGVALGAFAGDRFVGVGIVVPHVRAGIAQLAFLHVSDGFRGQGIGGRLSDELDAIARALGDDAILVSATPSKSTVDFYRGRGYAPAAVPLPELYALEPEDVHLEKRLSPK